MYSIIMSPIIVWHQLFIFYCINFKFPSGNLIENTYLSLILVLYSVHRCNFHNGLMSSHPAFILQRLIQILCLLRDLPLWSVKRWCINLSNQLLTLHLTWGINITCRYTFVNMMDINLFQWDLLYVLHLHDLILSTWKLQLPDASHWGCPYTFYLRKLLNCTEIFTG